MGVSLQEIKELFNENHEFIIDSYYLYNKETFGNYTLYRYILNFMNNITNMGTKCNINDTSVFFKNKLIKKFSFIFKLST